MGEEVSRDEYSAEDFDRFRAKVSDDVETLHAMLAERAFDLAHPRAGVELEVNLVDNDLEPAHSNTSVLASIADPQFVPELGLFNIELNLPPRQLGPRGLPSIEYALSSTLNDAEARARSRGVHLVVIGILPTIGKEHLTVEALSKNKRFALLNRMMRRRRGEPFLLDLDGHEPLRTESDSILPEAACTSHQVHLQVGPSDFPKYWNASQAVAGIQVAMGANSPFFCGHRLVAETRVPLFADAIDVRTPAERRARLRRRVWFGEHWISSVMDLYEENLKFDPLLPEISDEDDDSTSAPKLAAMTLHNGTIYRWNRPVYAVAGGVPHLRVENRVLPAGPTSIDMVANEAFHAGLVRSLAEQEHSIWAETDFEVARRNFNVGVRDGIDATMIWPGLGEVSARDLVLRTLLPVAAAGLESWGVGGKEIGRYLGVIEQRAVRGVNGASWQTAAVARREEAGENRPQALRGMLGDYMRNMHTNEPVHSWGEG